MNDREDLGSVLSLGWETACRAWHLLAPGQDVTFTPQAVGLAGRDMDQLAFDLRRLELKKPGRLAFSVAFILNGLASQAIQFDRDLADKASQIAVILAEMLLELEATSQITTQEPVEIVDQIRDRWGLVLYDDHFRDKQPHPHFSPATVGTKPKTEDAHPVLLAISEELVCASESLLKRVLHEGQFPYSAALSRIHHLGTAIRDQVISLPLSPRTIPVAPLANRQAQVLIIDDSPFFRMLLTTAIEAAGYAARAVTNLAEAQSTCDAETWNLVVCDEIDLVDRSDPSQAWLRDRVATWNAKLIALSHSHPEQSDPPPEGQHRIRRTDISGLLNLIKLILGPRSLAIRMSA